MKLGAMQPYFLPYLGYFGLIKHTDKFVINGIVQYRKESWVNRNRILCEGKEWDYITIPIKKHSSRAAIKEITIHNEQKWKAKLLGKLQHYKKIAPYYTRTRKLLEEILSLQTDSLMEMNIHSLSLVCQYLGIPFNPIFFSDLNADIKEIHASDDWGLVTAKAVEADEYWNPPGGKNFYDPAKYKRQQIRLRFLTVYLREYNQQRLPFVPGLSILDVMMFNNPAEIHRMLNDYKLESLSYEGRKQQTLT